MHNEENYLRQWVQCPAAKNYSAPEFLQKGAYACVFRATHLQSGEERAIKIMERNKGVKNEYKINKILMERKFEGYPRVFEVAAVQDMVYIISELLGPTMLFQDPLNAGSFVKFPPSDLIYLGLQLTEYLEAFHGLGYVHGDIKPNNILIGKNVPVDTLPGRLDDQDLYLIDYGLSKPFLMEDSSHIKKKQISKPQGCLYFLSLNQLDYFNISRRDDMESLMYTLIFLFKGDLPWVQYDEDIDKMMKVRKQITIDELCAGLPQCFHQIFGHVFSLGFSDEPNYALIKQTFLNGLDSIYGKNKNSSYNNNLLSIKKRLNTVQQNQNSNKSGNGPELSFHHLNKMSSFGGSVNEEAKVDSNHKANNNNYGNLEGVPNPKLLAIDEGDEMEEQSEANYGDESESRRMAKLNLGITPLEVDEFQEGGISMNILNYQLINNSQYNVMKNK